jgi:hypothetical protein
MQRRASLSGGGRTPRHGCGKRRPESTALKANESAANLLGQKAVRGAAITGKAARKATPPPRAERNICRDGPKRRRAFPLPRSVRRAHTFRECSRPCPSPFCLHVRMVLLAQRYPNDPRLGDIVRPVTGGPDQVPSETRIALLGFPEEPRHRPGRRKDRRRRRSRRRSAASSTG